MPRIIELPSRGITVEFSDRATDEQIQDFLDREYPRSGQDVAYELGQDPKFHRSTDFTLEDYEMYRDYMSTSAQPGAWESAYSYLSSTVKGAAKEAISNIVNPNPIDGLKILGTGIAAGTGDLVDLTARAFEFQSAEDTYQKHLEENKAADSESERKKYLGLLNKDYRDFKRQMDYQGFRQKIVDASPAPYMTEAASLVADPSVFITGGTSAIGKTGAKLVTKAGAKLGTGVRKVGQTADKLGMVPERIAGAVAGEGAEDFVRGATTVGAGAGLAGIGAGPGVYAFGALKGGGRTLNVAGDMIEATAEAAQRGGRRGVLDQASELAETAAGQKILSGLSRIETPLAYGVEAGKGALYGGAIGGGLGFVAEGKDGFFHGLAMGSMMGAPAGVLGRGIADVTGFRYAGMSRDDAVKYLSSRPDAEFAVKALDRMSAEDAALIGDAVELGRQYGVRVEFHDDSQRPVGLDPSISHTEYKGVEVGPDGVYINTDRIDGSTVAHEVFHSIGYHMGREQFIESIKGVLIGQRDPVSGNLIREGDVPIETLKQFGRAYATQFSKMANKARREGKSEEADTLDRRASEFLNQIEAGDYSKVIDEFGAYYFDAFVRGEEPKILIGGEKDLVKNTLSWAKKKMAANFQRDIARQGMDFSQGVGAAFIRGDKRQFALPAFDKLIKRMIKDGSVDTTHRVPVTGIPTKEAYKLAQMHGAAHLFELDASGQPIGAKTKGDLDAEFEADFDKVLEQLERLPSAVRRSRITEDAKGRKKLIAESITPEEAVILQDSIRHLNPYQRQMLMDLANGMTGDGGKQTYRVSYWKASGASRSKRKPYDQFEVSEREALPFSLEMNKTGGLYFRFVDMDAVRGNLRKATRLSEYKNLYPNFKELESDFLRYLENLDSESPVDSAAFLGGGETGVAKRNLFYEGLGIVPRKDARLKNLAREGYTPKRGRNFAFKSFRIERVGNMTPTGERIAFSDSRAYERGMENLMPDDGTVRAEPDQTFKQGVMRRHNGAEDARYMPSDGNDATRQVASEYMRRAGLRNLPHSGYLRPEESHLKELADWMQTADHRPNDPEVAASYEALKNEVIQQYETALAAGLKAEPWEGAGEPYANSREMMADLKENGHMFFYRTENGFGESGMPVDHPMLEPVPFELNGRQLLLNDLFRIVHDYFGHTQQGFQFGPRGEYNAYKEHSAMFTEAAQGALAAETLAQNAWVNYGPHIRRKDGSVPAPQDRDYTHPSDRPFAEQKANVVPAEIRYMVDTPDVGRHITGVGDTAENLRQAITRRPATGVAKNQSIRFHDESDRPIVIGSDQLHGGKNFDLWIEENQKWLTTEEVSDYRKWYSELRGEFEKEFGKRDADKMMMSWLGAQQNASPLIGMQNVFRVEDRLDGITSGKKGGLADEKIEYILKRKVPPKGFGAKLSDFVDAGYLRKTRTYVGGDPRGGQPFVADVHTGRDSGHVDHTTLSRLIEKSKVGKLFVDGTPVKVEATKTKKVLTKDSKGNKKVKIVPEEAVVNFEDGRRIAISRDMTGSPSDTVYEGISVWGNQLTDYLNKANYEGGNWTPAEVQAVGWMRVLRQYDLPQNSISETWMANTHRVSAELNYMMGNVLPSVFPDFQSLPQKAQERITRDVTTRAVQDLAKIIGGSLRVRQLNVGLGYWQGQRSPAVQAFVMGSPEAGAIFRDALAYVSEQDTSFMVTFGKGGKGKQAVSFSRLDGGQLNQSDVNSFIDFVEKQGKADSRLIKGFSAYATPDNKGLLIAGLTDKSAPKVYDLIKRWAEDSGLDIQAKKFSAVVEGSRNEWAKQKEGQGYLDGIVRRGGSERVRAIHDYRGRYFDLIEQAFKKHAPESLSQETSPSKLAQGRADFLKEPSRGNDPNARFMPDIGGQDSLGMFSAAERATVDLKQERGSASQMLAMIKKAGVKDEEIAELGLDKFLEGNRKVSKDEIVDYLVENQITVEETVLGELRPSPRPDMPPLPPKYKTKHSSYVEPGADEGSYRELLLRLPEADQSALREKREAFNREMWKRYNHADPTGGDLPGWYQYATPEEKRTYRNLLNEVDESRGYTDGHYDEYPNVLAHVRFNDRTSEYGKTLFLEEIQSDWHQKGRKMGYNLSAREYAALESEFKSLANDRSEAADVRRAEIVDIVERDNRAVPGSEYLTSRIGKGPMPLGVPDAPFKTSWHELTMKRMISYAAKHGYDAIAWTKGEAQFQRYGSEEIAWVKTSPNTWKVKGATQGIAVDANIEGAARARRIMKEGGKEVRGPGDVKSVIEEITRMQRSDFSPENYESHVDKMTNRIWSQMQSEDAGTSLPRKEGMEGFYDRMLPKMKTWKKLGLKVESGDLGGEPGNYDNVNAHIVKLTPEVKAKVLDTGIARFMPDASVPGAEKNSIGWSMILSKAGKWRVYDPSGALAGIAGSKAVAERIFRTKYKRELRRSSLVK